LFENSDILLHFQTREDKSRVMLKIRQISHFLTPCEIQGRVDEISGSIIKASLTTEPPEYMAVFCAAAGRGVLIKKESTEYKYVNKLNSRLWHWGRRCVRCDTI